MRMMVANVTLDKRKQSLRMGLILGSIAIAIFIGFLIRAGLFGR